MIKLAVMLLILSGCSSNLSEDKCREMNWEQRGETLGKMGHYFRPEIMAKGCDQKNLFSQEKLKKGYDKGIVKFCSPESGKYAGLVGRQFFIGCPEELEPAFRESYNKGFTTYLQRKEIRMSLQDRNLIDLNRQLWIRTGTQRTEFLRSYIDLNRLSCSHSGQCPIGSVCDFDVCRTR